MTIEHFELISGPGNIFYYAPFFLNYIYKVFDTLTYDR